MTALGELATLPRHRLLTRLREAEARAARAEMRLACAALAEAFGAAGDAIAGQVCATCGHCRRSHVSGAWCSTRYHDACGAQYCECAAFVASTEAS